MSHVTSYADIDSVTLNGRRFKVAQGPMGGIDEQLVNVNARKVSQGDPGPDDHPLNSTWIQDDWSGGGQIHWTRPDTGRGRFDWSTANTMHKCITLPPMADEYSQPGGGTDNVVGLGVYDNTVWASWGTDVKKYNFGTDAFDDIGTNLTAAPVTKGVVFVPSEGALAGVDIFCIPVGASFNYINATTVTSVAKSAVSLFAWDGKLFRLGQSGEVEFTSDLTDWFGLTYLPDGSYPYRINMYLTVGGDPAIYVTSSSSAWVYDFSAGTLLQTQLTFPRHPDQGKASGMWRGEYLVSVADGMHRYNRSTVSPAGLDRDDGLPVGYRGVIVDMEPAYNGLYVLMQSDPDITSDATDPYFLNAGDDYMTGPEVVGNHLVMVWNGMGWHYIDNIEGHAPTTIFTSDANNVYGLWYAVNKKMYHMPLTRMYYNPKEVRNVPVKAEAIHETSWYNFGWEGQPKLSKTFEMKVEDSTEDETVQIEYKLDDDNNDWLYLGTISEQGEHAFYFGRDTGADIDSDDATDYSGEEFERIKFKFTLRRGDVTTKKPIIRWHMSVVKKLLRAVSTWRMALDITTQTNGYTDTEQRAFLKDLVKNPTRSYPFTIHNETYKVDVTSLGLRSTPTKTARQYFATVNLAEAFEDVSHDN